jgi:hypothetical protein
MPIRVLGVSAGLVVVVLAGPYLLRACSGEAPPPLTFQNETAQAYRVEAYFPANGLSSGLGPAPANGRGTVYLQAYLPAGGCRTDYVLVLRDSGSDAEVARSDDQVCFGDAWRIVQRGTGQGSVRLLSPRQTDPP